MPNELHGLSLVSRNLAAAPQQSAPQIAAKSRRLAERLDTTLAEHEFRARSDLVALAAAPRAISAERSNERASDSST
jgi:hypothetical protein